MNTPTIYCGYDRAGIGCTKPAVALVETPGRAATACTTHLATVQKWVSGAGRTTVKTTPITAGDTTAGDHQDALFDIGALG